MKRWWYIARRLQPEGQAGVMGDVERTGGSPGRIVAEATIATALAIMIVSLCVTTGFKHEIERKLYGLVPHIEVSNALMPSVGDSALVDIHAVTGAISSDEYLATHVRNVSGELVKPIMLKTDDNFEALRLRAVDGNFDWQSIAGYMVEGTIPSRTDTMSIVVSRHIANRLTLHAGERVMAYFVGENIKARRLTIAGVYETQLDAFDDVTALAVRALVEPIMRVDSSSCHSIAITVDDPAMSEPIAYSLYSALMSAPGNSVQYSLVPVTLKHRQFFAWLDMLDMNVTVIIILMLIVSCFAVISTLLMIVLRRTSTIGLLKALGAPDRGVRAVFIFLTLKSLARALLIGNVLGLTLAIVQHHFHIIHLDPASYYMNSVPIEISPIAIVLLNAGFIVVSLLSLLIPSIAVTRVSPATSMRVE